MQRPCNIEQRKEEKSEKAEGARTIRGLMGNYRECRFHSKSTGLPSPRWFPLLSPLMSGPGMEKCGSPLPVPLHGALDPIKGHFRCFAKITELSHSWIHSPKSSPCYNSSLWKVPVCLSQYVYRQLRESLPEEPAIPDLPDHRVSPAIGALMFREHGAWPDGICMLLRVDCECLEAGDLPLLTPLSKNNKERVLTRIQPTNEHIWPILFHVNSEQLPTF